MLDTIEHSPAVTYLSSGTSLLPVDRLISLQDSLGISSNPGIERKPFKLLIAAEACIDIALQVEDSVPWIDNAEDVLDTIIYNAHSNRDHGNIKKFKRATQTLINAYIRKAEIPNWRSAIDDKYIANEYGLLLNAGRLITHIAQPEYDGVYGRAVEYVPLLLGSRAVYRKQSELWYGRASLQREDARRDWEYETNTNWDVGVNLSNSGDAFIDPELRLQIAARQKSGKGRFDKAGIKTILAKNYDFDNPNAVIAGCLQEIGISTSAPLTDMPFSSGRLDDITGNLHEEFVRLINTDTV